MMQFLVVAAGGAIGAAMRHLVNMASLRILGPSFPWGTLLVNIAGSLAMGLFIGWLARRTGSTSAELRLFVATGILGGFTTFSAFSLDFANLWQRGDGLMAAGYAFASVTLSLIAVFAGLWIVRAA